MGLDSITQLWPTLFVVLQVIAVGFVCAPFGIWAVARSRRRKAYGPGGGRK